MHIYCNGDSFVAGVELADELLPGYPGMTVFHPDHIRKDEKDPGFKWYMESFHSKSFEIRQALVNEISRLEKERAFPNQLRKFLNASVINNALGGSSMDRIARTTLTDLYNLKKLYPYDPIIAIIGTTHYGRSEHAKNNGWTCVSVTSARLFNDEISESHLKQKIIYENDYHWMMNFYKNIILIQDFCKVNDIKLLWIAASDNMLTDFKFDMDAFISEDIMVYSKYANLMYTLEMFKCLDVFEGQPVICPGGHLGPNVHEYIAARLAKKIGKLQ